VHLGKYTLALQIGKYGRVAAGLKILTEHELTRTESGEILSIEKLHNKRAVLGSGRRPRALYLQQRREPAPSGPRARVHAQRYLLAVATLQIQFKNKEKLKITYGLTHFLMPNA